MKKLLTILLLFFAFQTVAYTVEPSTILYRTYPERYTFTLKEVLASAERDLGIKIEWAKNAEPYQEKKINVAPWKLWNDPEKRLLTFLAPFDLTYKKVDETTYRVFRPEYYVRPESEGKAHLDRLLKRYPDLESWKKRNAELRAALIDKFGLRELLAKPHDLKPVFLEKQVRDGYTFQVVRLEILPNYYYCGTLYEPIGAKGPRPIVLCPHGHGKLGRFAECQQMQGGTYARMGAACFVYGMFAWRGEDSPLYDDVYTAHYDPISGTMQTLTSIRVLDFMMTLPNVDKTRVGITGASGGGTQTFVMTALDDRISVSIPVVMASSHFFGGCACESGYPVHLACDGMCNIEIAAMAAPRPMLLVGVTQDWTRNYKEVEFPYCQKIYSYYGAKENVDYAFFDEPHGYQVNKRLAAYPFMAKYLGLDASKADESRVTLEPIDNLLAYGKGLVDYPANGVKTLDELKKAVDSFRNK